MSSPMHGTINMLPKAEVPLSLEFMFVKKTKVGFFS